MNVINFYQVTSRRYHRIPYPLTDSIIGCRVTLIRSIDVDPN